MNQSVVWQRIEGGIIFASALYFYLASSLDIWWFIIFLFSVDITMIGYLVNKSLGAYIYNLGHSFVLPGSILVGGYYYESNITVALSLIWIAHIGLDRALGYGLKLTSGFRETHLGRIGK